MSHGIKITGRQAQKLTLTVGKAYCSEELCPPETFLNMCGTVASSFWSSRLHKPVVCSTGPSVLATVVITQEECGLASPPAAKLKSINIPL